VSVPVLPSQGYRIQVSEDPFNHLLWCIFCGGRCCFGAGSTQEGQRRVAPRCEKEARAEEGRPLRAVLPLLCSRHVAARKYSKERTFSSHRGRRTRVQLKMKVERD
jgi:hypothetical protein